MVEADGRIRPACCTPAWDGAVINTDTKEVMDIPATMPPLVGPLHIAPADLQKKHACGCEACLTGMTTRARQLLISSEGLQASWQH
jgi:predicted molibdopterin-dependent oxidoreductase YjgC